MTIEEFIDVRGIQSNVFNLKSVQRVLVSFRDNNKNLDQVSFDLRNVCSVKGKERLARKYRDFCSVHEIVADIVEDITVIMTAELFANLTQ